MALVVVASASAVVLYVRHEKGASAAKGADADAPVTISSPHGDTTFVWPLPTVHFGDTVAQVAKAFDFNGPPESMPMREHPRAFHNANRGIWFFFTPNDLLDEVRLDPPFSVPIAGVTFGSPSSVLHGIGAPKQVWNESLRAWNPVFVFTFGDVLVRYDLGPADTVSAIFLLRRMRAGRTAP